MPEPVVWTFFYGSYINRDVLAEVDLRPARWEVASLSGFDISIEPLANLRRSERDADSPAVGRSGLVFGVLATATHRELDRLYTEHARDVLGGVYLPEAVLTRTADGSFRPALCYLAPQMPARPADPAYVERIVAPAKEMGFPDWYVRRLESYRS